MARIRDTGTGGEILEVRVNRDPDQYASDDREHDKQMLTDIIEHLLLRR